MLRFNKIQNNLSLFLLDLNTYHVKVQSVATLGYPPGNQDLNTYHVKVQFYIINFKVKIFSYLNTYHVKVQ